jgi:hypothetical protein
MMAEFDLKPMNTSLKEMRFAEKPFSAYASSLMPLIEVDLRL